MDFETGNKLKGYIQKEIKQTPMHSNYGYNYYFSRKFLELLFENPNRCQFVLRGSCSQLATLKKFTRPITDIDIITFDRIEHSKEKVEQVLCDSSEIKFNIKQRFVTTNATICYRILCQFENIQHLITLDMHKDVLYDRTTETLEPLFSKDKPFEVNSVTLEEHLATKLYVLFMNLQLNLELGKTFRRFKDFYDVYKILQNGNINEDKVMMLLREKIACDDFLHVYHLRDGLFTKNFIEENRPNWNEEARQYEFQTDTTFEKTIQTTNEFISKNR